MNAHVVSILVILMIKSHSLIAQNSNANKFKEKLHISTLSPFSKGVAIFTNRKGKMGVIDQNGKIIAQPKYEIISTYKEGLAFFWMNLNYNGYLNNVGEEVHKSSYNSVSDFEGGLSEVWIPKIGQKFNKEADEYSPKQNLLDVRRNFLDHSFRLIVPYKYDSVATYQAGKVRLVKRQEKFGFLDQKAQEIIPLILEDVDLDSVYYWREYRRVGFDGLYGFLNTSTGRWFIRPKFKNTLPSASSITWVKDLLGWKLIDQNARTLTSKVYDEAHWVVPNQLAAARTKHGYVLINQLGKHLTPTQYDGIYAANEGVSVVLKNGRYGYIDVSGNEIATPIYDKATYFHNGKGLAFGKYAYLFIDRKGQVTVDRPKPFVLIIGALFAFSAVFMAMKAHQRSRRKRISP